MGWARLVDGKWLVHESFEVSRYDFEGTADEIKANIDLVVEKARVNGMVGDGRVEMSTVREYYDDYCINISYEYDRSENDKERAKREAEQEKEKEAAAKKRKAAAEKKKLKADSEYNEFLRLKEKFGEL
jgi:hypothetical protein